MNNMAIQQIDLRISEINAEIQTKEGSKKQGITLMIVSVFFLWPLLVVGGIMYTSANNRVKALEQERAHLLMQRSMILEEQGRGNVYDGSAY